MLADKKLNRLREDIYHYFEEKRFLLELTVDETNFMICLKYNNPPFEHYQVPAGLYGVDENKNLSLLSKAINFDEFRIKILLVLQCHKDDVLKMTYIGFLIR